VLGRPIAHSLSPVIHNAGYAAAGLRDWMYAAHDCGTDELAGFIAGLDDSWRGLSLTMPLKEVALAVADEVAPLAAALGAANTLVRVGQDEREPRNATPMEGARWLADNTDAPGMVDALRGAGVKTADRVAILGAGGTARAALAAAASLGADEVVVYARRTSAVDELRAVAKAVGVSVVGAPWSSADDAGAAQVVVSTVPRGVADGLAVAWEPGGVLFDALYDPWPTPLAASAQAAGCAVVSGLDLLLAQGVRQFELFTGVAAPIDPMRSALLAAALRRRS
jgi:shikimate dehydrogenase